MSRSILTIFSLLALHLATLSAEPAGGSQAELQTFKSVTGTTVKARFVRRENDSVVLRAESGEEKKIPIALFSEDSKQLLLRLEELTSVGEFRLFGSRGSAHSIVYVMDISGSMVQGQNDRNSYDRLEKEITNSLTALSSAMKFNVIAFAAESFVYAPTMTQASASEKEKAIRWIKSYSPCLLIPKRESRAHDGIWVSEAGKRHNGTCSNLALQTAFEQAPDTILFVSDGQPTDSPVDRILFHVQEWQGKRNEKAAIHSFAYRATTSLEFMKKLSTNNGGKFEVIQ